ncbi:phospholipase D-like domain-containing protein [Enterobacter roggenkampii]|nr:phospholipase D-like domain-containing protein [Enterobacter roggenkampii]
MHNKFMVVDGNTVQTGSFNYTASAVSRNAKNVLLIKEVPELAATYQGEFNRLWNESERKSGNLN